MVGVDAARHPEQAEHVLREERQVEADEDEPEVQLPEPLVERAPEHLRPPVVEAAEDPEDRAAEEHVVQVRDDEVGVGHLPVDRERGEEDPGEAADREDADEAERPQHRRVERDVPAPDRREPVEDLHAGRDRDDHRAEHEEDVEPDRQADREHVVRPDEQRVERDARRRDRDRLVAEDRLAREDGQDLRDDPHRGQDHDVDLGVPEEPEDVLVEERAPAVRRVEEVRARLAVEQHQRQPRRQRRQHDHEHPRVGDDRPAEERDAHPRHAGRAHVVDRHDEVDRAGERRRSRGCAGRGSRGPGRGPASAASRAARTPSSPLRPRRPSRRS